jgi:ABC-type dipeptide/oligopeptide/nickel transport system permease subunit
MAETAEFVQPAELRAGAEIPSRLTGFATGAAATLRGLTRNRLTLAGLILTGAFVAFAVIVPFVAKDPLLQTTDVLQSPSWAHPFGTDHLARDLLARVAAGARVSLFVALVSVVFGLLVALPLGMTAGYFGGSWVDEFIMRGADVILALPLFVLAMVFLGLTGTSSIHIGPLTLSPVWKVILLIAIAAVPLFARVARSATLVEKHEGYVDNLRVIGVPKRRIILREILVNVLPPVMAQAFLWMAIAIFAEAALSFLGLGVQPPNATLGNLLYNARDYLLLGSWWYSLFPGIVLLVAIVGFNLLGDGLTDSLDGSD